MAPPTDRPLAAVPNRRVVQLYPAFAEEVRRALNAFAETAAELGRSDVALMVRDMAGILGDAIRDAK